MALRKMLGSVDYPEILRLMRLIGTQSSQPLAAFAADYAAAHYLPIAGKDARLVAALEAVRSHLHDETSIKAVKPLLKDARTAAQEETEPVRQAAKRAIATAAAVITTPTNALGFTFYGAAAYAYHTAGVKAPAQTHDELASQELTHIRTALEDAAIPDESDPVSVQRNC
ncbi:MAG: hypothetical protein IJ438_03915 [Clostridia bacterium]|nr:hypothetical protein [Clostridia bacterium]